MKPAATAAVLVLSGLLAAPAQADPLVATAPGATSLAAAGGAVAWLEPVGDGRGRIVVLPRRGEPMRAPVAPLPLGTPLAIGTDRSAAAGQRLLLTYPRRGRARALDLRRMREEALGPAGLRGVRAVAADSGRYVASTSDGLYAFTARTLTRRITTARPTLLAARASRVAYVAGGRLVVVRQAGGREITFALRGVRDVELDAERVYALVRGARSSRLFASGRLRFSPGARPVLRGRVADPGIREIAPERARPTLFLTSQAVHRFATPPFPAR
jgi:hypothetical protein